MAPLAVARFGDLFGPPPKRRGVSPVAVATTIIVTTAVARQIWSLIR